MNSDNGGLGGTISVDGESVEVDLAEFGWPADRPAVIDADDEDDDFGDDAADEAGDPDDGRIRLQKALAHAGVASRRACESLITKGRVVVNGQVEHELGSRIDPETDEVRVDGVVVQLDVSKRYFVLNKPQGIVSTMSDEHDRPDLTQYTKKLKDRLYNVGRLDTDTSGLLILTNDGELANKLAHPSFGVTKTYIAKVRGRMTGAVIQQLKYGIELKDGPIRADRARILSDGGGGKFSLVELTLHSGRNRIVRRMLAEVGFPVIELVRRQFGPLNLGTLPLGEMRELSRAERGALLSATDRTAEDAESGQDRRAGGRDDRAPRGRGGKPMRGGKPVRGAKAQGGRGFRDSYGRDDITAGRPGDGKGARGMRGVAARGNPNVRRFERDDRDARGAQRPERGGYNNDRNERSFDRNDRGAGRPERSFDRNDRGAQRPERGGYNNDRNDRGTGRPERSFDRNDRGAQRPERNFDRNDRNAQRPERGGYNSDRNERSFDRNDRNAQRPERSFDRNDRGAGRPERSFDRNDRGTQRPERSFDRNDRGAQRSERGGFSNDRNDRGAQRPERGGYSNDRNDRGGNPNARVARNDRGAQRSDRDSFSNDRNDRGNDRGAGRNSYANQPSNGRNDRGGKPAYDRNSNDRNSNDRGGNGRNSDGRDFRGGQR